MFMLKESDVSLMFQLANFEIPEGQLVFFGLRGNSPLAPEVGFAESHQLITLGTDFKHMRCTIGQWRPGEGFSVFPGSTVPGISGVMQGSMRGGTGVNMLAPCYLTDLPGSSDHRYAKGDHGLQSKLGPHRAFRNAAHLPIWRTGDDAVYEGDDKLLYQEAYDNLHCARNMDPSAPGYSSLGCQVVAGAPGGPISRAGGEKGDWKRFVDEAYATTQTRFRYALFTEREAIRTVALGRGGRTPSIRFGSTGELAAKVQQALIDAGYDIGTAGADGVIGFQSLLAIRDVQLSAFGPEGVDLVVGPATAQELRVSWPA